MPESDLTSEESLHIYELQAKLWCKVAYMGPAEVLALIAEIRRLRGMVEHLAARVAAQSELLSRRAEKEPVR